MTKLERENRNNLILEDYNNGIPTSQIAKKLNIHHGSIYKILKTLNCLPKIDECRKIKKQEKKNITENRNKIIVEKYKNGLSCSELASLFKLSIGHISNILIKMECERRPHKLDLLGERFGRLVVINSAKQKGPITQWLCVCDCGETIIVSTNRLRRKWTASCGCFRKERSKEVNTKHGHLKNGQVSAEYNMYRCAKRRAKLQNVSFDLELSDIIIPKFCPVFPEIELCKNFEKADFNSPTVDKLIPSKGYTKKNIRIISYKANMIKNMATYEELRRLSDWLKEELELNDSDGV